MAGSALVCLLGDVELSARSGTVRAHDSIVMRLFGVKYGLYE